jgi:hypothetical protein
MQKNPHLLHGKFVKIFNTYNSMKHIDIDTLPSSLMDSTISPKVWKEKELGHGSQHFEGRGACYSSRVGLGQVTSRSIIHADLHKPNNKVVSVELEHF